MCCMDTFVATDENPRDFLTQHFHYWFCSPKQVTEVSKQVSSRTPTWAFHADALEQYGRRDKILISGVDDDHKEDVYQKVVDMTEHIWVTKIKPTIASAIAFQQEEMDPMV